MSNLRVSITNLLKDLETTFRDQRVSDIDRNVFFNSMYGTLDAASNTSTIVYGHSLVTIITSIRTSLIAVCEQTHDPKVLGWWNPVTAALLRSWHELAAMDVDDLSSRVSGLDVSVTSGPTSGIKSDSRGVEPSQKKKGKNNKKPLPTVKQPTVGQPQCLDVIDDKTVIKIRSEKTKGPWFTNLNHVKCIRESCSFCEKLWHSLHLTKCSEIKCHKRGTICNTYGWSAHIFPTMWVSAKKDHDAGKDFPGIDHYLLPKKVVNPDPLPSRVEGNESPSYAKIVVGQKRSMADFDPKSPKSAKVDDLLMDDWNEPIFDADQ